MGSFSATLTGTSSRDTWGKAAFGERALAALGLTLALLGLGDVASAQCIVGFNRVLAFDGVDDAVVVPHHQALEGFGDFTIEAWTKTTSSHLHGALISKGGSFSGARPYWFGGAGQSSTGWQPRIVLNYNNLGGPPSFQLVSPVEATFNTWHHIAASRTGSSVSILLDGVPVVSATFATGLSTNASQVLSIGNDLSGDKFGGSIDEVRIWNVGRTASQINQFMNVGLSGVESGLVGYWRFDEGSGQLVQNSAVTTGTAANGTLGATPATGSDDPTWVLVSLPLGTLSPLCYVPPCSSPPCGCTNTPCAALSVNGIGPILAQGPFQVVAAAGSTLTFSWSGSPNQPIALFASPVVIPNQMLLPNVCADLHLSSVLTVFNGLDPYLGPFYMTTAAGTSTQTLTAPSVLSGAVINVQGIVFDSAMSCSNGIGFMTTASFSIHL